MGKFVGVLLLILGFSSTNFAQQRTFVNVDYHNWRAVRTPGPAVGIVVDPQDDNTWLVPSPDGLFITRNAGANWVTALRGSVAAEAVMFDPTNPNRAFAVAAKTLYTSTDKGRSWTQKRTFAEDIVSLMVSPSDGTLFLGPTFSDSLSGLYVSRDRGDNWSTLSYPGNIPRVTVNSDIEEGAGGNLFVAVEQNAGPASKILLSRDRGATWSVIGGPVPSPPTKLYWSVPEGVLYSGSASGGLYATSNLGQFWKPYTFEPTTAFTVFQHQPRIFRMFQAGRGASGLAVYLHHVLSPPLSPNLSPGQPQLVGLEGMEIDALATNRAGTRMYGASRLGLIWTGDTDKAMLNASTVYVSPGGALGLTCLRCWTLTSPSLRFANIVVEPQPFGAPEPPDYLQTFTIPGNAPQGVHPAQLSAFGTPWNFTFTLVVGNPQPEITRITSVRFQTKPHFARSELVTLFGQRLGGRLDDVISNANTSPAVPWETELALTRVTVDDRLVPLHFSMTRRDLSSQINIQLPSDLTDGPHIVRVHRMNLDGTVAASTAGIPVQVRGTSPTYFGSDALPVFIQNVTQDPLGRIFVSGSNPAAPGDVGVIYATGLGRTAPELATGEVAPSGVIARVLAPITILIRSGASEWLAEVLGAAASPQFPGVYQVAFRFPAAAVPTAGTVDLVIESGDDRQTFRVNFIRR